MKVWQCTICKYIHKGEKPPEKCPICGVDASKFIEINEADIPIKKPKQKPIQTPPEPIKKESKTIIKTIEDLLCKHHAHPVSVHTPNGILPAAVVLWVLAWLFNSDLLAKVAVINLLFVMTALPFVIYTGALEWKRKYNGAMTMVFKIKILAAALTSASCAISIVWYLIDPAVLHSFKALIFLFINIVMLAAAGIAGYIGGKLVFKD
ncbi:MAG: rubredoxin-like domain-containing protein [Pseudomonadota bacterium]